MPIKPSEYRKGLTKLVTLSSGAEFLIRKVRGEDFIKSKTVPLALLRYSEILESENIDQISNISDAFFNDFEKAYEYMDEVIIAGVVEPKIVKKPPEECGEDELSIHELTVMDTLELFGEIARFSDIPVTTEEKKEMAPFPSGGDANSDRHDGKEVSQITDGDSEANVGRVES